MIETNLDKFKKSYILEKAEEMAESKNFKTSFIINRMHEYMYLLSIFLKENKKRLNDFINTLDKTKKENVLFFKILNFIIEIPNILKIVNNKPEINYTFLDENFLKLENNKKINELQESLKKLEKKFKPVNNELIKFDNDFQFNLSDLYKFGESILDFLNNKKIRIEISSKLINWELESNPDKFEELIKEFIKEKKISNNWNTNKNNLRI